MHDSFDYRIGKTRGLQSAGYFPDALNPDFDPGLMVEICAGVPR
jgi:hypothetical protein